MNYKETKFQLEVLLRAANANHPAIVRRSGIELNDLDSCVEYEEWVADNFDIVISALIDTGEEVFESLECSDDSIDKIKSDKETAIKLINFSTGSKLFDDVMHGRA